MTRWTAWAVAATVAAGLAGGAAAEERLVVVELFTSQGCSSCPPADELLRTLSDRDEVLPLALHVDYWDYIGWKDKFGSAAHTQRQKAYAHAAGARTIYTPQMVVGGTDHLVGNRAMELGKLIQAHGAQPTPVDLAVARKGEMLSIHAEPRGEVSGIIVVQLVRYDPLETVEIERGENAGRTITYSNIVTEWREIGRWDGKATLEMSAEAPGPHPAAVILQEEGPGPIVAAAVVK